MNKKKVVKICVNKFFKIFGAKKAKNRNYLLRCACETSENLGDKFVTYRERYKFANSKKLILNFTNINEKCAIILQGPIRIEDNFTYETVNLYKKYYPETLIIVSTWENIDFEIEKKLKNIGVVVLKNKKPNITGLGNINYQLISTMAGIRYAKEKNYKYILKTRTDQRIYKMYFLEYFLNLIRIFPLKDENINQRSRVIVGPGIVEGSMFKPYMISDFIYFGNIEDIEKIFNKELDSTNMSIEERSLWTNSLKEKMSIKEFLYKTAPELHLMYDFSNYVSNIKKELNMETYWEFVKKHLICLGWNDIELYWPKYEVYNEAKRDSSVIENKEANSSYCWDFSNWLMLYNNTIKYKKEYEEYSQKLKK